MSHPGHLTVATIAAYGPCYAGQHVARIQAGKTDVPISDCWLFGDLAFCRKWNQSLKAINVPIANQELENLFHGVNPQNTSTESSVDISGDSVITQIVNHRGGRINTARQMHPKTEPCDRGGKLLEHKCSKSEWR